MTSSFYLAMALCVGQVPGNTASQYGYPYSQYGNTQTVTQPVTQSYVKPQAQTGPLRSWLNSLGNRPQTKAPCDCNKGQGVKTTTPYAPGTSTSYSGITSPNYSSPYQAIPQNKGMPTGTAQVNQYEESTIPSTYSQMPAPHVYNQSTSTSSYQPLPAAPVYLEQPVPVGSEGQPIPSYQEPPAPGATNGTQNPQVNLSNLTVAKKYENQVGHEADYSWITGHLFYVHSNGGRWVVRYAMPGEVDKFGGSVVLAPGVEMKNYREGDLICIYGEILDEGRTSTTLGGALYRVNSIQMIERADQ